MEEVYGYLDICVVSGRGFQATTQGLGRLGQVGYAVKVVCGQLCWCSQQAYSSRKSGTVQWHDSTSMRCTEGVPQRLVVVLMAVGLLRKAEEAGRCELDLRPLIVSGQESVTATLKKAGLSCGEVYLQLVFSSTSPLKRSVSQKVGFSLKPADVRHMSTELSSPPLKDIPTSLDVYSPLGFALASCKLPAEPSSAQRQRPPSAPPTATASPEKADHDSSTLPSPPRNQIARRLCRSETVQRNSQTVKLSENNTEDSERDAPGQQKAEAKDDYAHTGTPSRQPSLPESASGLDLAQALSGMRLLERCTSSRLLDAVEGGGRQSPDRHSRTTSKAGAKQAGKDEVNHQAGSVIESFGSWMRHSPWEAVEDQPDGKRRAETKPSALKSQKQVDKRTSISLKAESCSARLDLSEVARARTALGGLIGGEQRKTRLEEETLFAVRQGDSQPSAPPADFSIFAYR